MKRMLLLAAISLLFSCSADTDITEPAGMINESEDTVDYLGTRAVGDNLLDALGFGYDATGEFGSVLSVKSEVISATSLYSTNPEYFTLEYPRLRTSRTYLGADSYEFTQTLTREITNGELTIKNLFAKELTNKYTSTIYSSKDYAFALHEEKIMYKRIKLERQYTQLMFNRSVQFQYDITTLTPAEIVSKYGTHVLMGVEVGGKVHINHKAKITVENRHEILQSSVNVGLSGIFSFGNSSTTDTDRARKASEKEYRYYSVGGNPSAQIGGTVLGEGPYAGINVNNWIATVNQDNGVFIGVPDGYLIPLWYFIDNGMQTQVRSLIDSLMVESSVIPEYLVRRYYDSKTNLDHSYGMRGLAEVDPNNKGYVYQADAWLSPSPYDDSPYLKIVYKYWNSFHKNSLLTSTWKDTRFVYQGSTYVYQNCQPFAVYSQPVGEFNAPLYEYMKVHSSTLMKRFNNSMYVTDRNDPIIKNATYMGILGYVKALP